MSPGTLWAGVDLGLTVCLLVSNLAWHSAGHAYRRAVPGSLHQADAAIRRRRWRWPGFMFWPYLVAGWPVTIARDFNRQSYVWFAIDSLLFLLAIKWTAEDWRKLRKELAEDEDDWLNRGKRAGKRAWSRVKSSASIGMPVPVGSPA